MPFPLIHIPYTSYMILFEEKKFKTTILIMVDLSFLIKKLIF